MLTLNKSSSARSAGVSVNKVILVGNIGRNRMVNPFGSNQVIETIENMRQSFLAHYESVLARYSWKPILATVECAYAWLLNWAIPDAQHSMPISRCFKAHKRESQKCPRHFFSAQKLNMRNAP
jgi:hypothetical protein